MTNNPEFLPASRLILFLAYEEVGLLDLTGPQTVFWAADKRMRERGLAGYERCTASLQGGMVQTAEGMAVETEALSSFAPGSIDTIVVPGSPHMPRVQTLLRDLTDWLNMAAGLARRTASIGAKFVAANGGKADDRGLSLAVQQVVTQAPELFSLGDLMQYWNPEWTLERAGVGGAGGGMRGIRGNTYLDGEVLATYPRDEVRGLVLRRTAKLSAQPRLTVDVAADPGQSWRLEVFADNRQLFGKVISGTGASERQWQTISVPLDEFAGKEIVLRLFQRVLLVPAVTSGNAYWRGLKLQ